MRGIWSIAIAGIGLLGCAAQEDAEVCSQPGVVCELAGNGEAAFTGDGRPALETSFYLPSVGRRGPDGLLYIMDLNNMRLRRIDVGGMVETIAGNGFHMGATEGMPAKESGLESPVDFEFLADGRVAFVSSHDPRAFVVDVDGSLQLLAGSGLIGALGNEGDRGPATEARFIELSGIAIAPDGTIYLSDRGANRIRKISDGIITTFYGTGASGYLKEPEQLALDAAGNLYVADSGNSVIRKITPDGQASIVAGTLQAGFSGDGGLAVEAQLAGATGIAIADDGTLFIADRFNRRVRQVSTDGTITTIAGTGSPGPSGNFGPAIEAEFGYVSRLSIDVDGGLIVADQSNHCVRKIAR